MSTQSVAAPVDSLEMDAGVPLRPRERAAIARHASHRRQVILEQMQAEIDRARIEVFDRARHRLAEVQPEGAMQPLLQRFKAAWNMP